jgi:hypothetical protein
MDIPEVVDCQFDRKDSLKFYWEEQSTGDSYVWSEWSLESFSISTEGNAGFRQPEIATQISEGRPYGMSFKVNHFESESVYPQYDSKGARVREIY